MPNLEETHYATGHAYGEADVLARKILREGTKVMQNYYKWRGNYYWILGGRVLTREQGAALEAERKARGLIHA